MHILLNTDAGHQALSLPQAQPQSVSGEFEAALRAITVLVHGAEEGRSTFPVADSDDETDSDLVEDATEEGSEDAVAMPPPDPDGQVDVLPLESMDGGHERRAHDLPETVLITPQNAVGAELKQRGTVRAVEAAKDVQPTFLPHRSSDLGLDQDRNAAVHDKSEAIYPLTRTVAQVVQEKIPVVVISRGKGEVPVQPVEKARESKTMEAPVRHLQSAQPSNPIERAQLMVATPLAPVSTDARFERIVLPRTTSGQLRFEWPQVTQAVEKAGPTLIPFASLPVQPKPFDGNVEVDPDQPRLLEPQKTDTARDLDVKALPAWSSKPNAATSRDPLFNLSAMNEDVEFATVPDDMDVISNVDGKVGLQNPNVALAAGRGPVQVVAQAHAAAQQMAVAIQQSTGGTTEITLSPEELGRVRLAMSSNDGVMTVAIVAERAETQDLMRRNIDVLAQEFRALGYRDVGFSFQGQSHQHTEKQTGSDPSEPAVLADEPVIGLPRDRPSTGLDLRL